MAATGEQGDSNVTVAFGTDERRMQVRAYNYWASILNGRDYPSIEDLVPADVADFSPNSVLLDFTKGAEVPATPFIGAQIREECGLEGEIATIADVPGLSLLSRLTDHYMQILANRSPVGFEAEFINRRGQTVCYRGILMPFSSNGHAIDFIYGVINWKVLSEAVDPAAPLVAALSPALPVIADDLVEEEPVEDDVLELVEAVSGENGLADYLQAARDSASVCREADGRSRAALYRALALAYDFAVAARRVPGQYAELLEDAGIKIAARAPMTPVVKLVFGADYDKGRLTEFAAALSNAERMNVDFGGFEEFIASVDGGLKGVVAAERKARRPDKPEGDALSRTRQLLHDLDPIELGELPEEEEFLLVLVRRSKDRGQEEIGLIDDQVMLERAMRRVAR